MLCHLRWNFFAVIIRILSVEFLEIVCSDAISQKSINLTFKDLPYPFKIYKKLLFLFVDFSFIVDFVTLIYKITLS